ncbi:PepSY domain-containing protein [Maricurvus nonylphenolicus]|uniref:PepSY domain-containing protein n=1 Tax=Maricurvus nonylphenolicus TaxID=1008307 RepID=UPI0036F40A88
MKFKRYWYLLHRWCGIAMCLFFAMWFFSGVVMIYVGFPKLDHQERLEALPIIDADSIFWGPDLLLPHVLQSDISSLRLTSVASRPIYVLETRSGENLAYFADNGEPLTVNATLALKSAEQFVQGHPPLVLPISSSYLGLIEIDQWSVSSSLNTHRPLHRVSLNDSKGTHLYISSRTGEVVRDVNQSERVWNWLGANLHWLYPVQLRKHPSLWADVVIVISLIACLVVLTGAIVGIQRLRIRKPYRGKDYTPYTGMAKWHHLLGLGALVFLSTYTLSGLMSMNPWGIFDDKQRLEPQLERYHLGLSQPLQQSMAFHNAEDLKTLLNDSPVIEISWHRLNGVSYIVMQQRTDTAKALLGDGSKLSQEQIAQAISQLLPDVPLASTSLLDSYNLYYYSHHERHRPLPALKAEFEDNDGTWFYIDANTGVVLDRLTSRGRLQRWLYNGLHSLDFNVLIQNRPLWDIVVITLSIIGFMFSVTAINLGWRRLR